MDLGLTEDQEMVRKLAADLAAREIAPKAAQIDESGEIPREIIQKIAASDLFGLLVPPPFGGLGKERLDWLITTEELAKASASVAMSYVASTAAAFVILAFGNDNQRRKYLPLLAKGEKLGAVALTEPSGGTNWQMTLRTTAIPTGSEYMLKGNKVFISNAEEADVYIVVARTDIKKGPMGISVLIVEKDTPGFTFGTKEKKLGLCGDVTGELVFEDCRIPKDNLIGQEGGGMKIISAFAGSVCGAHGAIYVGIAQAAMEATIKYTKERLVVEPMTLANVDDVQSTIADMAAAVEAARLLVYRTSFPKVKGAPDPMMFMSAAYCSDMAVDITGKAVRLHGGYGCTKDFPVERYFRDAKTLSLYPTSEFLRLTAGKMLLGIPLGPPPGKH